MTKNRADERPYDAEAVERDAQRGTVDAADARRGDDTAGVVLHEERLVAGVETTEAGRVEVRKRIVVEEVTVTVPVRREVVDVVRVYADGSEEALEVPASTWQPRVENLDGGPAAQAHSADQGDVYDVEIAEGTHKGDTARDGDGVIVLHEERPVVSTQVYAVERLRLEVAATKENVTITEPVQREVVEVDGVRTDVRAESEHPRR